MRWSVFFLCLGCMLSVGAGGILALVLAGKISPWFLLVILTFPGIVAWVFLIAATLLMTEKVGRDD